MIPELFQLIVRLRRIFAGLGEGN